MNFDEIVLGEFARRLISRKARLLRRQPGFETDEREDLEHELVQWLLLGLPLFDPFHAHINVFVTTVIESRRRSYDSAPAGQKTRHGSRPLHRFISNRRRTHV